MGKTAVRLRDVMKVPEIRRSLHRQIINHESGHSSLCIIWLRDKDDHQTCTLRARTYWQKAAHERLGQEINPFWCRRCRAGCMQQLEYPSLEMLLQIQVKAPLCPGDSSMVTGNDSKWPQLLSNLVLWLDHRGHLIQGSNVLCSSHQETHWHSKIRCCCDKAQVEMKRTVQTHTQNYTCFVYRFLYMYVNIQKKVWNDRN